MSCEEHNVHKLKYFQSFNEWAQKVALKTQNNNNNLMTMSLTNH